MVWSCQRPRKPLQPLPSKAIYRYRGSAPAPGDLQGPLPPTAQATCAAGKARLCSALTSPPAVMRPAANYSSQQPLRFLFLASPVALGGQDGGALEQRERGGGVSGLAGELYPPPPQGACARPPCPPLLGANLLSPGGTRAAGQGVLRFRRLCAGGWRGLRLSRTGRCPGPLARSRPGLDRSPAGVVAGVPQPVLKCGCFVGETRLPFLGAALDPPSQRLQLLWAATASPGRFVCGCFASRAACEPRCCPGVGPGRENPESSWNRGENLDLSWTVLTQ